MSPRPHWVLRLRRRRYTIRQLGFNGYLRRRSSVAMALIHPFDARGIVVAAGAMALATGTAAATVTMGASPAGAIGTAVVFTVSAWMLAAAVSFGWQVVEARGDPPPAPRDDCPPPPRRGPDGGTREPRRPWPSPGSLSAAADMPETGD